MKYEILGNNMQSVRITLDEGERIFSDSGKLVSKSSNIKMTPRMVGGILGAIERKSTGSSALLTEFESSSGTGNVSVAGILPGKIVAIQLGEGEEFFAEHDAFLAAQDSIKFTLHTVGISSALFGGAGLILQKFSGPGNVFIHVAGDITEYNLDGTYEFEIDPGHIAGFDSSLTYKIKFVDNIKTAMFGGVGLFLAVFSGKGRVITHTVSRFKLASEIYTEGLQQAKKSQS